MQTVRQGRESIRQDNTPDLGAITGLTHDQVSCSTTKGQDVKRFSFTTPDPFTVAAAMGYKVLFMKQSCRRFDGALVRLLDTGEKYIVLNSNKGRDRQAWTLFHEIGHTMQAPQELSARTHGIASSDPEREAEAEAFAAAMMMPAAAVRRAVESGQFRTVAKLARVFHVNNGQMRARLIGLGLHPAA